MSDRAVGQTRMSREQRKFACQQTITELWRKGYRVTATAIAKRQGIKPSTYLYAVLAEMYIECKINMIVNTDSRNREVFHYSPFVQEPSCALCAHSGDLHTTCEGDCANAS